MGSKAEDFTMVLEGNDGLPISSCGTHAVVSPITYSDNTCEITLEMSVDGSIVEMPLGDCAGLHKMKVILDNRMYKLNVDHQLWNKLFGGTEDVINIPVTLNGCSGYDSTSTSPFVLYTNTEFIPLDVDSGLVWGVDSNGKPIMIMESTTGNTVCDDGFPVELIDTSEIIFKTSFE